MVRLITELPIPGRSLVLTADEPASKQVKLPVHNFLLGSENRLVAATIDRLLPGVRPQAATGSTVAFLSGSTGTGKTHLARGLCDLWQEAYGVQAAEFVSASDFQRDLAQAIRTGRVDAFRGHLRAVKFLAIDDAHQFAGQRYLTEELIYTIDALADRNALLLMTSSKPLSTLGRLPSAITSRLTAGHVLNLHPPGFAARAEFVRRTARALGQPLTDETIAIIAEEVAGTVNEISGLLIELFFGPLAPTSVTAVTVTRYLSSRAAGYRPNLSSISRVVSKYYRVPQKVLKSSSRKQSVVFARGVAIYLTRTLLSLSFKQIGRKFGGRDHTTVMHSYRKIERLAQVDLPTQQALADLQRLLSLPVSTEHS